MPCILHFHKYHHEPHIIYNDQFDSHYFPYCNQYKLFDHLKVDSLEDKFDKGYLKDKELYNNLE